MHIAHQAAVTGRILPVQEPPPAAAQPSLAWRGGGTTRLRQDAAWSWRIVPPPERALLLRLAAPARQGALELDGAAAWTPGEAAATHLVMPGSSLAGWLGGPADGLMLALDTALLDGAGAAPVSALDLRDAFLDQLLASLDGALESGSRATAEALGRAVATRLAARHPAAARATGAALPAWRLRRVRHFVEANLAAQMSLAQLAEAAGLSPFHFARGFTRSMGMTPFAWLRRRRCAEARLLLATTALPLAEVAQRCGFRTQSHFTSVFQQSEGLPPGRWRALARGDARHG